MQQNRHLAAIMFTDIVGYTALMGHDEEKAFELLYKNRELHKPFIKKHNGNWIKELGDGILCSFNTATDAVLCAGQIQIACRQIPELNLRIGIHIGDVIFENNDVFGDGVNIASRLQSRAKEGTICISEAVHNNIMNKNGINSIFLREETLKNVKNPIKIFEVNIDPFYFLDSNNDDSHSQTSITPYQTTQKNHEKSIAVLPFVNMSNDPEQEYFSDGITEEILNSLAHVKSLKVAARTSSFYFKGKNVDLREIGQQLNVNHVLEGSIRKQANKLRITAQLINIESGYHLWSEKYDRELDDIFAIQDEIAIAITEELKVTLLEDEIVNIYKAPSQNKEAYDLFLKGRFYFNKRGAGIIKSIEYFKLALEKDSELTYAYTGLADAYCILALYCIVPSREAMPTAKTYAEKAIKLNSSNADAYIALAFIQTFYDWNWQEGKKGFQYAYSLNENNAAAYYWYSYYLTFVEEKFDEAISIAKKGVQLEPLIPISHHILSIMYMNAKRFDEGVQASKKAIELEENSYPGLRGLGLNLAGLERYNEAVEALLKAVNISSRQPLPLVELSWVYSLTTNIEEIQKIETELILRSKTEYISSTFLSCLAYYLKKYDESLQLMEEAFVQKECILACVKTYPLSGFLKQDPLFSDIIKKLNFPT